MTLLDNLGPIKMFITSGNFPIIIHLRRTAIFVDHLTVSSRQVFLSRPVVGGFSSPILADFPGGYTNQPGADGEALKKQRFRKHS